MLSTNELMWQSERSDRDSYHRHALINSSLDDCKQIQDEMLAIASAFAFRQRELLAMQFATEEALSNAIKHGNCYDPSCKISVNYKVARKEFRVRITDEGDGFNPYEFLNPNNDETFEILTGRGLTLMHSVMSGLRHNKKGNAVEMWLSRSESDMNNRTDIGVRKNEGGSHDVASDGLGVRGCLPFGTRIAIWQ